LWYKNFMSQWRFRIGLLVLVVSAAAFCQAAAGAPASSSAPANDPLKNPFWGGLAKELKLDPDEQAKLGEKIQARNDALLAFDQGEGKGLAELVRQCEAAKKARLKDQVNTLKEKIRSLQAARERIRRDQQGLILSIFSADQLDAYEGYRLYVMLCKCFGKAKPTGKQKEALRELARQAGPELAKIDRQDAEARDKLGQELLLKARGQIHWSPRQVYSLDEGGRSSLAGPRLGEGREDEIPSVAPDK
jgi:hypothetical protein